MSKKKGLFSWFGKKSTNEAPQEDQDALVESERLEAERIEAERVEAQRLEAQRVEAERVEAER
ncbi:MAG: signal recognition particle-docking protein FtsY, partial [Psychromonas sp.]